MESQWSRDNIHMNSWLVLRKCAMNISAGKYGCARTRECRAESWRTKAEHGQKMQKKNPMTLTCRIIMTNIFDCITQCAAKCCRSSCVSINYLLSLSSILSFIIITAFARHDSIQQQICLSQLSVIEFVIPDFCAKCDCNWCTMPGTCKL